MPARIKIAFLWHMHQPFYRDPYSNRIELPWVRLHGLKDYFGMAHLLTHFPQTKMTFNLVPSLLVQLQNYINGEKDIFQDLFIKDAATLETEEIHFLVRHFFSANYQNLIKPWPRYRYLHDKKERLLHSPTGHPPWEKVFDLQEIRDLQVWFTLTHFDEFYKNRDDGLKQLLKKGEHFSEADKQIIKTAEQELLASIIPAYQALAQTGQIELSTTPFYHPIMPLLLDPQQGRVANPLLPPYDLHFHWPGDVRYQIQTALDYMEKTFDQRPTGIWPSEGSLSRETLEILDDLGVTWTATDETNLAHSLDIPIERDELFSVRRPDLLYRPYQLDKQNIYIFFRDRHISDLISFFYRDIPYQTAAHDLVDRIKRIDTPNGNPAVVSIILDGENPWEYYPNNGRDFLQEVFQLIEKDKQLETVTFSQALATGSTPGVLKRFAPGSWVNGNFDTWIGDEEDRRGWELLEKAREIIETYHDHLTPEQQESARQYLSIAQGSDWFWWFGKENFTSDLDIFDSLFRKNLQKLYDIAGIEVPREFSLPVCSGMKGTNIEMKAPNGSIHPRIDGCADSYFEWLNAGRMEINSSNGAMNISNPLVNTLFYGFDKEFFYLRLDTPKDAHFYLENEYSLDILVKKKSLCKRLPIHLHPLDPLQDEPASQFKTAVNRIIEIRIPLSLFKLQPGDSFYFQIEWKSQGEFFQLIPANDYFHLTIPTPKDYACCWLV